MITYQQFIDTGVSEAVAKKWYVPFCEAFQQYIVYTPLRMAHTLSQVGHESSDFKVTVENLNYSADRLQVIFKKYFPTQALANAYARNPEKIANRVYANRMGNGPESSGDGWRNRGSGPIQLTGYNNIKKASVDLGISMNIFPELLRTDPAIGSRATIWYLWSNKCVPVMDQDDVVGLSKMINVGNRYSATTPNGLQDRKDRLAKNKRVLGIK